MKDYDNVLHEYYGRDTFGHAVKGFFVMPITPLKFPRKTYAAAFKACFSRVLVNLHWNVSDC